MSVNHKYLRTTFNYHERTLVVVADKLISLPHVSGIVFHDKSPIKWQIDVDALNKTLKIVPVDKTVNTIFKYELSVTATATLELKKTVYGVCVFDGDIFKCGLPNKNFNTVEIKIVYAYEAIMFCSCAVKKSIVHRKFHLQPMLTKARSRQDFSDVQFMVENKLVAAHKIILADRSEVFRKMFSWNVDDDIKNEPISIVDVSYGAFNHFINAIYYGATPTDPEICLEIVGLAEKYDVQDIKSAVETSVIASISMDNAINILIFSHLHNAAIIKKGALEFCAKSPVHEMKDSNELTKFPDLIFEVFEQFNLKK